MTDFEKVTENEQISQQSKQVPVDSETTTDDYTENIQGIDNYSPETLEQITIEGVTQAHIVSAIKKCLEVSTLIKPSKTLINSVYSILDNLFIKEKRYVILEAPTGSGKTIIGFMVYFCIQHIYHELELKSKEISARPIPIAQLSYFLTSAKLLQEQIDTDLDRFEFRQYITMLKGVSNYVCTSETDKLDALKAQGLPLPTDRNGNTISKIMYNDRPCKGLTKIQRIGAYDHCDPNCPYQVARFEASEKSCTVLNYAYFLNIMRSEFNPFFGKRFLTIADEAHLIPDIVCNIFNYEFTQFALNQLYKLFVELESNYGTSFGINDAKESIMGVFKVFKDPLNRTSVLIDYYDTLFKVRQVLESIKKQPEHFASYIQAVSNNLERVEETLQNRDRFIKLVNERPEDIFFESEQVAYDNTTGAKVYKHIVRDLSEAEMVKTNFLSKLNKGIFMSATLGDIDEYATMMGMEPDEYVGLRLPSQFDFSKSPIIIAKSAWLNYANFDKNINKVVMDTIKICNDYHPNEKGIIHTSTFKICNIIKDKIELGLVPDKSRFLFYSNSNEKEQLIELMRTSTKPYVIVGPSLYEGLDLKDDLGRFNILVKVPYGALTDYVKKKMERFPFWYKRNTIEKIVQAIGRTNRHTNDYSTIYLLDSLFDKIIYETNEDIIKRLKYQTIY